VIDQFLHLALSFKDSRIHLLLIAQEGNAVHECSSGVVCAFPYMALGTRDEVRCLIQAPLELIAVLMIQKVLVDVFPLFLKQLMIVCVVGKNTGENQECVERFRL